MGGRGASGKRSKAGGGSVGERANREAVNRLETIIANSASGVKYNIHENLWERGEMSRTYYSITAQNQGSTTIRTYDYGFVNNKTGEYRAGRHDLRKNYTLSGAKF